MATRSLTDVFILMRNNALQSRHISEQHFGDDSRQALVQRDSYDLEAGIASRSSRLPPDWVDGVEEVQYEISRIKQRVKDLSALHDKHANRPTLDDSVEEEHCIEIQTQEITQMLMRCQRLVQQIHAKSRQGTKQEQDLAKNITSSLAQTVQELSLNFRRGQSAYLKKLRAREERSQHYFETDLLSNCSNSYGNGDVDDDAFDRGFSQTQLQAVEDNSLFAQQRDKEISHIVQSIQDLNDIFKDLSMLVVDQGSIVDRIDYNIEHTHSHVERGLQQLQKAEKYQKKNKKMLVIVVLFVITILLILILIATKS